MNATPYRKSRSGRNRDSIIGRRARRGFTLVEVLIATTLTGFVVAGSVVLVRQALNTNYYDAGRLQVNNDMLRLTRGMATDAVYSNYFILYDGFYTRNILSDGQTGDMVVFVTQTTNITTGAATIASVVGYFRDAQAGVTTPGPVRRFIVTPNVAAAGTVITSLLPVTTLAPTFPEVIPLAVGLGTQDLFYDYSHKAIMMKSQIQESGNLNLKAQSTYNFTVWPRG